MARTGYRNTTADPAEVSLTRFTNAN